MSMAQDDTDQWVAMAGNILKTFPSAGSLNTDIDDHHNFYHDVLNDLKKVGTLVNHNVSLNKLSSVSWCSCVYVIIVNTVHDRKSSLEMH